MSLWDLGLDFLALVGFAAIAGSIVVWHSYIEWKHEKD